MIYNKTTTELVKRYRTGEDRLHPNGQMVYISDKEPENPILIGPDDRGYYLTDEEVAEATKKVEEEEITPEEFKKYAGLFEFKKDTDIVIGYVYLLKMLALLIEKERRDFTYPGSQTLVSVFIRRMTERGYFKEKIRLSVVNFDSFVSGVGQEEGGEMWENWIKEQDTDFLFEHKIVNRKKGKLTLTT